ncbi:MAG: hypothetical protein ABIL58_22795 [Pseudomonadota bacterium]
MNLILDLSRHCIETEVRRQYNRAVSDYFCHNGDPRLLEAVISLTQQCLERLDFSVLRHRFPSLAGRTPAEVVVSMEDDAIHITIDAHPITPVMRSSA